MTSPKHTHDSSLVAQAISSIESGLGEGPLWIPEEQALYWVDISGQSLNCFADGEASVVAKFKQPVCAVAKVKEGGLLLAVGLKILLLDRNGRIIRQIAELSDAPSDHRCNDGKVDPHGRFWVGTMSPNAKEGAGALYRVEPDGQTYKVLEGLCIPNGMAWSSDHKTFYFIDSPTREVWAHNYEPSSGCLADKRVAIRIPDSMGIPDGMAIDREDHLWIAHWGDAMVRCWDPRTSELIRTVRTDAALTTSCCFGGADLDELFITTASGSSSNGCVFRANAPSRGLLPFVFGS
jgi:sugar lactone lactonase YvrE